MLAHERTSSGSPILGVDRTPGRREFVSILLVWIGLVTSVLSWRVGTYYDGGTDPVVVAKALLSLVATILAVRLYASSARRTPIGWRTPVIVSGYLACAMIGGFVGGTVLSSAVLTVRVVIIVFAVTLLVAAFPVPLVVSTLSVAVASIALVLAVTGLPTFVSTGRLSGGVLPVNPNQIAVLLSLPVIVAAWRLLAQRSRRIDVIMLSAGLATTWLTGSRTGLAAVLLALVVMAALLRRLPPVVYTLLLALVPIIVYLSAATDVFGAFIARGNVDTVWTLSNRTVAWSAAFQHVSAFWDEWFGRGLSVKTVAVSGMYWDTQVIDNSWIAAFVKAGFVGMTMLALWVCGTMVTVARSERWSRSFWFPVLLYLTVMSVTSSGLIDSDTLFVMMGVVALIAESACRRPSANIVSPSGMATEKEEVQAR